MDTMEITKIVASACGALLIFLLLSWGADALYRVGPGEGGEPVVAYLIEVEDATPAADSAAAGPTIEELVAAADVTKGAKVFAKCKACHRLGAGANATGPTLFEVVGRAIGSVAGFGYSGALADRGGNWDINALNDFLTKPSAFAPGTKMSFSGLKKDTDRANLIAYLQSIGN
jgi:cytochrome c